MLHSREEKLGKVRKSLDNHDVVSRRTTPAYLEAGEALAVAALCELVDDHAHTDRRAQDCGRGREGGVCGGVSIIRLFRCWCV